MAFPALPPCVAAVIVGIPVAAGAAGTPDFFNTERFVPPNPGTHWTAPFALPAPPGAETGRPLPGALSLPELTELALANNPRTREAWHAVRAAAAGVGIERADDLPTLTGTVTLQRGQAGGQSGNQIDWLTRYGPAVTLTYLLFDFGAGENRVRAAEYQAIAAALTQNRVLQDLVFQVEQAYYRYLGFEQLVRSNELFLKSVSTSLDATRRRREAGLATVADVYRAETQVAQARLNLTRSEGELEKARGILASIVGLPVNARLSVRTLATEPQIREVGESIERILARARSTRPDLVASEAEVRAARARVEAARREGWPALSLSAGAGRTYFPHDDPVSFTRNTSVLLTLSVPLFTGFQRAYQVRQAEARAAQAEAARDALQREAELEVWQAYYDVQTAAGGVRTTAVQLRAAQQTAEATLARYQSGFGSLLDLLTAQVDESNARVQRIQSYLDWFTAVARLNFAIGATDAAYPSTEVR